MTIAIRIVLQAFEQLVQFRQRVGVVARGTLFRFTYRLHFNFELISQLRTGTDRPFAAVTCVVNHSRVHLVNP